jgi:hypothetical protein
VEDGDQGRIVDVDGMELHLDPEPDENGEVHTALPPRMETWRRRSVAGAILTGIGLGLKQALETPREDTAIIVQSSGEPPSDLPVEADLGGILPSTHVVRIRPWLLDKPAAATPPDAPTSMAGPEAGPPATPPDAPTSMAGPEAGPAATPPDAPTFEAQAAPTEDM